MGPLQRVASSLGHVPVLHVIVLNWNGTADTVECVASLREAALPIGWLMSVLIVDNGSSDDSTAAFRETFPGIRILETGSNLGYAGGNNAGLRQCLASAEDTDVVTVVNNDTIAAPTTFAAVIEHLSAAQATAVGPVIEYADDGRIWWAGADLDRAAVRPWHRRLEPSPLDPSSHALTGCCIAATAATWRRVGLFDERYFLIFEDTDWSLRARALGINLEVVANARLRHKVSRSFDRAPPALGTYYFVRNGLLNAQDHFGLRAAARFAWINVVEDGAKHSLRDGRPGRRDAVVRVRALGAWGARRFGRAPRSIETARS